MDCLGPYLISLCIRLTLALEAKPFVSHRAPWDMFCMQSVVANKAKPLCFWWCQGWTRFSIHRVAIGSFVKMPTLIKVYHSKYITSRRHLQCSPITNILSGTYMEVSFYAYNPESETSSAPLHLVQNTRDSMQGKGLVEQTTACFFMCNEWPHIRGVCPWPSKEHLGKQSVSGAALAWQGITFYC